MKAMVCILCACALAIALVALGPMPESQPAQLSLDGFQNEQGGYAVLSAPWGASPADVEALFGLDFDQAGKMENGRGSVVFIVDGLVSIGGFPPVTHFEFTDDRFVGISYQFDLNTDEAFPLYEKIAEELTEIYGGPDAQRSNDIMQSQLWFHLDAARRTTLQVNILTAGNPAQVRLYIGTHDMTE